MFCVYINGRDNIIPQLDYGFSVWNSLNKNYSYIIIQDLRPYLVCNLLLGGYNAPASQVCVITDRSKLKSIKFQLLLTNVYFIFHENQPIGAGGKDAYSAWWFYKPTSLLPLILLIFSNHSLHLLIYKLEV